MMTTAIAKPATKYRQKHTWLVSFSLCLCVSVVSAFLFSTDAHADAINSLKQFITGARSAEAEFTQTVRDENGKIIQSASGTMQFSRPGKFRWVYR
jgi:chaperone LolA